MLILFFINQISPSLNRLGETETFVYTSIRVSVEFKRIFPISDKYFM